MKAIQTKYLPATNFRGSRIKATAEGWGAAIIDYPHEFNAEEAHIHAAKALLAKSESFEADKFTLATGGLADSYVHVLVPKGNPYNVREI